MGSRTFQLVTLLLIAGCGSDVRRGNGPVDAHEADSLVRQYLALELTGGGDLPQLYGCEDDDPGATSDYVRAVTSAEIAQVQAGRDGTGVLVVYHVLGRLYLGATTTFALEGSVDTVLFRVVTDTAGRPRIACGFHPGNNRDAATLAAFRDSMPESSRIEWDEAMSIWKR